MAFPAWRVEEQGGHSETGVLPATRDCICAQWNFPGCQAQTSLKNFPRCPTSRAWRQRVPSAGALNLSPTGTSELRVDLVDFEGNRQFAKYTSFKMAGEAEKYKLVLGAFVEGSAGTRPRRAVAWPSEGLGKQREPSVSWLCLPWATLGGDLTSPQFLHP